MQIARGIRNNNPGNLVLTKIAWQGKVPNSQNTDKKFEQFTTMEYGIRAMIKDVINDIKKGKNTVRTLINEYAPSFENDTNSYINDVSKALGITADAKITSINDKFILLLSKAIIKKENGKDASKVTDAQIKSAIKLVGDVSSEVLKVDFSSKGISVIPILLFFFSLFSIFL